MLSINMQPKVYTVVEITKYIKKIIDNNDNLVLTYISGEISNFKQYSSGHCYFVLKDADATIKAVMFKNKAVTLRFLPTNGLKVVAAGRISVFERDGIYQLYVDSIIPEGVGELTLAFEQLKEKLSNEGLFEQKYKKNLPFLPKTIGIVTSPTGAAIRDIITVVRRRHPYVKLLLYPVQVQGKMAGMQIAHAIQTFNEINEADVIIVGRGGGSIEDLWAFNEEIVVKAIFASRIPVISAVGHETDVTLSDFAADKRAATPSQAAEFVVPDYWQLQQHLDVLRKRLILSMQKILRYKAEDAKTFSPIKTIKKLVFIHDTKIEAAILAKRKLHDNISKILLEKKKHTKNLIEKLTILNPLSTVTRGYSIVYDDKNKIISDINNINVGDMLNIQLRQGIITAKTCEVKKS